MEYKLIITPAIKPAERHKIEDTLKKLGYHVWAGGQMVDGTECDIAFDKEI